MGIRQPPAMSAHRSKSGKLVSPTSPCKPLLTALQVREPEMGQKPGRRVLLSSGWRLPEGKAWEETSPVTVPTHCTHL